LGENYRNLQTQYDRMVLQNLAYEKKLEQEPIAKLTFEKFSNSCKREYIDWIEDAKTEKTRDKRMQEAIEMLRAGKQRNWKYQQ
jgi:uncharacterized protein YdeI (YjbR/CyaY-like superfamily)